MDHDDSGSGFSAANLSCASTASWISGKGMGTFLTVGLTHVISIHVQLSKKLRRSMDSKKAVGGREGLNLNGSPCEILRIKEGEGCKFV